MNNTANQLIESNEFIINKALEFIKSWYPELPLEELTIHARFTIDEKSCVNVSVDWENDGTQSVATRTYLNKNKTKELLDCAGENACR